ncbi:MAG: hypothetical protein R8M45_04460 [Ghiorsea sp.]
MISFRDYILTKPSMLSELAHLSDILSKKGNDFLDNLLTQTITTNIKIDTSALVVGNVDGEIRYYGREGRVEITTARRQGADLYEKSIKHLETRKLSSIPKGVRIFMEYFDDRLPTLIKYTQSPLNDLIISYITKDGKILSPADPLNMKMAKLLNIAPPPVLFHGKLNKSQKDKLVKYADTPKEDLMKEYGGLNFVEFTLSLFTPKSDLKYLIGNTLEGLVFYFDSGTSLSMAKITDPNFTAQIKKKQGKEDEFHTKIMDVIYNNMEHISYKVFSKSFSNKIDFVEKMTKEYLKLSDVKKLNVYKHTVTESRFARLTFALLPSSIANMVDKTWYAEDIFRILHFMFQTPKKRINRANGLTIERKNMVNDIIAKMSA